MNWTKRGLSITLNVWFSLIFLCPLWANTGLDSLQQLAPLPLPQKEVVPMEVPSLEGKHPSEYHFAITNPSESQVEAWLRGDFLALEGVFALDSTGTGGGLGNFFGRASEVIGEARAAIAEVRRIGNFISRFDGGSLVKLPVGMSKQMGDGTLFTVSINRMTLYPSHAELTVFVEVKTGDMEKPLYFGSPAIRFTRMGGIQLGAVGLLGDFPIPILNGKATLEFQGALIGPDNQFLDGVGTYANFDCDGVSQFNLDVNVAFDRSVIRPADLQDPSQIRSELNLNVQNGLNDIVVAISIDRPFVHPDKTDVVWTVQDVVFDFSESHNDPRVVFPIAEYTPDLPPGENGLYPMWKGVYIGEFSVQLPEDLFGAGGEPPQIGVNDVIIDHTGFTGFVNLEPVLSLDEGNMDGWAFSVDRLEVQFYQNTLAGFEFNGKVNLPIFNNSPDGAPQDTACIAYFSSFDIRDQQYAFSMNDTEARIYDVKMLRAKVTLLPTSRLDIVYSPETGFDATATLHGTLEVDASVGESTGGPRLQVPAVGFEGLVVANRNGFIRSGGAWDVDTVQVNVNAFTCTVSNIEMVDGSEPNTADLRFFARVNLGGGNVPISANGGFRLQGVIEELDEGRQNWRFERFRMDMLSVEAETPAFAFNGYVLFFDDLADYGSGFQGKMSLTLKKLGGVGIEAMGLFGSLNEDRYFFVDVMTRLPAGMLTVGALDFRGFSGGVYVNMAQSALVSDFSNASTDSVLADYDPSGGDGAIDAYEAALRTFIGRSLSGTTYTVDTGVKLGINFGVVVASAGKEEAFNANVALNMEFERAGGLRHIRLQGFANALAPISWSGPSCEGVSIEFTMEYVDGSRTDSGVGEFTAQARVFVNLGAVKGGDSLPEGDEPEGGDCALLYAGGVDIKFSSADWWINLGVPAGTPSEYQPDGPIHLVTRILGQQVQLTGYLDIGNRIPPFPGLPSNVAELTRLPNLIQDEQSRASGRGFAFGVNLHVDNQIDVIGIVSAYLELDIGFDIMLQYYNMTCANNGGEKIGFNGWYAAGQAWVYVAGGVSVLGFTVLDAAFAAAIQVKGPNPFYGRGSFAGRYSVLGGLKKGSFRFPIEFGDQCEGADGSVQELDYELISGILPLDMMDNSSVALKPSITFNYPVGEVVTLSTDHGDKSYIIQLDEFRLEGGVQPVQGSEAWSSDRYAMEFLPFEMLAPNTTYTLFATAGLYPCDGDGEVIGPVGDTDVETITFTTGDAVTFVPLDNVMAAWPADQQFNYYQDEGLENFLQLASGQDDLLTAAIDNGAILRLSNDQTEVEVDIMYDPNVNKITYTLPGLNPGHGYKAEVINPDQADAESLLTFYFRVSNYGTFSDKITQLQTTALQAVGPYHRSALRGLSEPFAVEELVGVSWIAQPTLSTIADLANTAWMGNFYAISVPGEGSFNMYGDLPSCDFSINDVDYPDAYGGQDRQASGDPLPIHAVSLHQTFLEGPFEITSENYAQQGSSISDYANMMQQSPDAIYIDYAVAAEVKKDYQALQDLSKPSGYDAYISAQLEALDNSGDCDPNNSDCDQNVILMPNTTEPCCQEDAVCIMNNEVYLSAYQPNPCFRLFWLQLSDDNCDSGRGEIVKRQLNTSLEASSNYPVILRYWYPDGSSNNHITNLQFNSL